MGETTGIVWAHSTFNAWRGCVEYSPGCENCYAKLWSLRNPKVFGVWGTPAAGGTRVIASESMWRKPETWNDDAARLHQPWRVFAQSLSDTFEDLRELDAPRKRLFRLMEQTGYLTWLVLTKRIEHVTRMVPPAWMMGHPEGNAWPHNVWIGFTAEDQKRWDERVEHAKKIPAPVRFASLEPQLGPIDMGLKDRNRHAVNWVIYGGESGGEGKARPFHMEYARSNQQQCEEADNVAPFFKQAGDNAFERNDAGFNGEPGDLYPEGTDSKLRFEPDQPRYQGEPVRLRLIADKGGDLMEFPASMRVRHFPHLSIDKTTVLN